MAVRLSTFEDTKPLSVLPGATPAYGLRGAGLTRLVARSIAP
jgi:hypothetical protein